MDLSFAGDRGEFPVESVEGYTGSESRVRQYIGAWRHTHQLPKLFLPLEYDPGQDAQVDWGEAIAVIGGIRQTVQYFVMRLCYSRRTFIMTFPSQNQESFLYAHVQAFNFFGGVPGRASIVRTIEVTNFPARIALRFTLLPF